MNTKLYENHLAILKEELVAAMGCTEPIAVAYAGAKAREILGKMPEHCCVKCSGNIIKNVKGVTVPKSGGMRGIDVAATMGIVGGDASRKLAVLQTVTPEDLEQIRKMLKENFCTCELIEGVENLYIIIELTAGDENAVVEIKDHHTNITRIEKNHKVLFEKKEDSSEMETKKEIGNRDLLNLHNIIEFADEVKISDLEPILKPQIEFNTAIAQEGLKGEWGAEVGKILLERAKGAERARLLSRAYAAAGSDARMSGCALPVVINSGSGNQGITLTMPVVVYANELDASEELRYRALAAANLISIHQKKYIGSLSAYCGATSAACGAACGIAYLMYKGKISEEKFYQMIGNTITNSICTVGGMVCDGAKSSCAAKISIAVETALQALDMSIHQCVFQPGEGLSMSTAEKTIATVGRMARVGMKSTDVEILNIMLGS
ncbi:serine dehydratase subunit alpha family protein [Caproicibacterium sp. BJN0003]|uniref:L-cysteine desulfidase family protein n=1 Tax=Caproicibacterium sp. BJN0003 TaxID=2994078 RepID=UPI00224FFCC5|nr:L-serine ammonia-lyase, iron-sulfur-dependent, subunit alpha [Caproicibacterium sp. BJN0003]UZT82593.1 L-serine ammonia-lyase, iron-sulfur-dependent, subunit alpha [Caproicibacterium sp. BJN0003]